MIELDRITVRFGEKCVLQDFSLQLPERGVLCLSGPSGCGKTTLARVLCFLQKPDSGAVRGLEPGQTAMLFQEDRLIPWLSVQKNLELVMPSDRAREMLQAVELTQEAKALPGTLSGGMRRRVALARALGYEARLLILDEPFKGLDAALKERLYPRIRAAAAQRSVLLISHEAEEIRALADAVLRLSGPPLCIET